MKSYKIMHMQAMGLHNWFKIAAWLKKDREKALRQLDKFVKKTDEHGFPDISSNLWISDGKAEHRNLNRKTPWHCFKPNNGKLTFDFAEPNEKFWKLHRMFLETHKKYHKKFVGIYEMREDYAWYPFANNVNGIDGINSPEALEVKLAYMRKAIEMQIEVFGKFPNIIPWNERNHYGDGDNYHKIIYDHKAVRDEVVIPLGGKYSDIWPDITLCEGAAAELFEAHPCSKPAYCKSGGVHGKEGQHRRKGGLMSIKHGFTTLADFMVVLPNGDTKLEHIVKSGNDQRMYTEDGNGTVGDGRYVVRGYRMGDAGQQYVMMKELIRVWKSAGFLARYGTFPHEALSYDAGKNLFIPDYRPRNINWKRIRNGVLKACREELGD